jgi:Bacterial regulatory helix-turn-helix protein, lysR family
VTQLTSFLAVIRGGSVTAAAEQLVVTQPSVSAAVAALSRELGVDLTERAGRGVVPTRAGEAFAPYAFRRARSARPGPPSRPRGRGRGGARVAHRGRDHRSRVHRRSAHQGLLGTAPRRLGDRQRRQPPGRLCQRPRAPRRRGDRRAPARRRRPRGHPVPRQGDRRDHHTERPARRQPRRAPSKPWPSAPGCCANGDREPARWSRTTSPNMG